MTKEHFGAQTRGVDAFFGEVVCYPVKELLYCPVLHSTIIALRVSGHTTNTADFSKKERESVRDQLAQILVVKSCAMEFSCVGENGLGFSSEAVEEDEYVEDPGFVFVEVLVDLAPCGD